MGRISYRLQTPRMPLKWPANYSTKLGTSDSNGTIIGSSGNATIIRGKTYEIDSLSVSGPHQCS